MSVINKDLGVVTAYAYAVAGGYVGTEAEFTEALANAAITVQELENLTAVAVTLEPGSEATASYADGVLTLGIPKGDKGDKGDTGNGIVSIAKTGSSGLVDTYTITYTNGNSMTFTVTNGAQGNPGPTGNGISSIAKTGTSGLVDAYTITFTDGTTTTFTVTNGEDGTVTPEQMAQAIADALAAFAGETHEDMTAGLAEQLLSDVQTTDKKPYIFRKTGADATREFDCLVGGSVVGNQLVPIPASDISKTQNGVTFTDNRDGSYTVATESGGATAQASVSIADITYEQGHVYYFTGSPSGSTGDNYFIYASLSGSVPSSGKIVKRTDSTTTTYLSIIVKTGIIIQTGVTFRPQIIDLTAMFGSTIADHAYTLEQATTGSGVAWLKSYGFFAGYQAYNAGSMEHVSGVSAHVMKDADENIIGNYPLDDTLTLRGIPKLSNGEIYYDGDTYASDGTVTEKYGITDLRAYDIRYVTNDSATSVPYFEMNITGRLPGIDFLCEKYVNTGGGRNTLVDNSIAAYNTTTSSSICIADSRYTSIEDFAEAIRGVYLVYKKATATTRQASPYQSPQICDPDGTEEYVTDGIPVGHETQYPANLKGEIERVMVQVPKPPTSNGTYTLKCTVAASGVTYAWTT